MKKILLLSSLILALYSPITYAADDQASVLVFDASGSMWGQLKDGRSKIEVAKEVIGEYLKGRDQSTPLGIIAYGHNRKGDCSDIEVLEPVGKKDHTVLANKLNKITPKGKTPLTDALALALKQIPRTSEEADIILITDGLETCDRDPCALAQKIADEGINIRAHVVGFGLTEKEVNSLSCIPEKTGGQLLRPQSGKELSEALAKVESQPSEPIKTEPSILSMTIRLSYKKGSVHPTSVSYTAINKETSEMVDLGKTDDTLAILQGQKIELPEGTWILKANGPLGEGKLEVTVQEGEAYLIPYIAKQPTFTLKNLGPYQLGQDHTFFLNLSIPMQKGKQLTAMLFPAGIVDGNKKRIDHEYLIGLDKGIKSITMKSPKEVGKYQIIIGRSFKDQLASFEIEYLDDVKPVLTVPKVVKPKERFAYELYGQWSRYNRLFITENGKKLSDVWLYNTMKKDGVFLVAPEKTGIYGISLEYKNNKGKKDSIEELAVFQVADKKVITKAVDEKPSVAQSIPKSDLSKPKPIKNKVPINEKAKISVDKGSNPSLSNQPLMVPANTFDGAWTLTNLNIDGDYPEEILAVTLKQSPEKFGAAGELSLNSSDFLGMVVANKSLEIAVLDQKDIYDRPMIKISFTTSKGSYSALLAYHPTDYDERVEAWGGSLRLNEKDVAAVLFENTTITNIYSKQKIKKRTEAPKINATSENSDMVSQSKNEMDVYRTLQGRWVLNAKSNELIRIIVADKEGDKDAGAYFTVYEEAEETLGQTQHEDAVTLKQQNKQLTLSFKTVKRINNETKYLSYNVTLNQKNDAFFKEVWKGVEPSFEQPIWSGYLQKEAGGENVPVYLEKMFSEKTVNTKATDIFLYDTDSLDNLSLVFTCEKASCSYDDKKTDLKGIPLLKDWAIQAPYYYSTAGGGVSIIPTILFVHTKTGLWFVLNQRQANTEMFSCTEFGKEGRLSDEEQHCSPKDIPDHLHSDSQMGTMMENVEFWRADSYLNESNDLTEEEKQKLLLFSDGEVVE